MFGEVLPLIGKPSASVYTQIIHAEYIGEFQEHADTDLPNEKAVAVDIPSYHYRKYLPDYYGDF
jgi:hypothetical protein